MDTLLEHGPQSISKLNRSTGVARTTIYSALLRLKKRGLVRRKSQGYASVWSVAPSEKLKKQLSSSFFYLNRDITSEQLEAELGVRVSGATDFFIFQGLDALLQAYQWFVLNHRNTLIQGMHSRSMFEASLRTAGTDNMARLSDFFKENKISSEVILPESITDFYQSHAASHLQFLQSLEQQPMTVFLVPDVLMSPTSNFIVAEESGLIVNWNTQTLVLTKNTQTTALLRCLFESLRDQGKLFDQATFLHTLIEPLK
jgi:sugar-specific transcriptional regulator TrmB